jgi:hypothetical protein
MRSIWLGALVLCAATEASAQMRITEWMYSGGSGEFIEFTNVGNAPVDLTGWSYDDDSRLPGVFLLTPLGVVQPGQSVVITEATAAAFRSEWSLPMSVGVLGEYTNNLGRNDEINLFDSSGTLADRLTYGDQTFLGSIRTQSISGNPATPAALGANDVYQWVLSAGGDAFGSYVSTFGSIGNPGVYVPEPAGLLTLALGGLLIRRR